MLNISTGKKHFRMVTLKYYFKVHYSKNFLFTYRILVSLPLLELQNIRSTFFKCFIYNYTENGYHVNATDFTV